METQKNVYAAVFYSLLIGMSVSTVLFIIGVGLGLLHVQAVFGVRPLTIVQAGVAVMILTPITRVAASLLAFAIDRDRAFVAITGFVLLMIAATLWLGRLHR